MKTKNYLGKHDENRGIVTFFVIFILVVASIFGYTYLSKNNGTNNENTVSVSGLKKIVEKKYFEVNKFKLKNNRLVIKGVLNDSLNENLIIKLRNIQIVLKDKELNDVYEYKTDYYITSDKIEFSSVLENSQKSKIKLDEIDSGEYFVLIRLKFESNSSEDGYKYKYYTLKDNTDKGSLEYEEVKLDFHTDDVPYLKIEK